MIQEKSTRALKNFTTYVDSVDLAACQAAAELILAAQASGG